MRVAFSPCPNDTFVFHAWVHGLIPGAPRCDVTYADVDVTNTWALSGEPDLVKVSYAALPWLLDQYQLLHCGGALGRSCGPLVVTRERVGPDAVAGRVVAIPSERSTANLLLRLWSAAAPPTEVRVVPFQEIMPGVARGEYDAGLVIHEARFVYQQLGLLSAVDLGAWWEGETGLPLPLGAILAHRERVDPKAVTAWVRASLRYAWAQPEASRSYVLQHAQELNSSVVDRHIALYVNGFTERLGDEGVAAVETLFTRAAAARLTPPLRSPVRIDEDKREPLNNPQQ